MKKTIAASLALGLCASGASAQNRTMQGSDTLYDITQEMLSLCAINPANLIYVGGGSGAGENAMSSNPITQQIAPMSKFLGSGCGKPAPLNVGRGIAHSLDAIGVLADDTEDTTCDVMRYTGSMPVAASANGNGSVECPNCVDSNADGVLDTYNFTEWQQALRIIFAGQHAPVAFDACSQAAPPTRGNATVGNPAFSKFCDSDVRHTLVNNWANMFETGCVDGECTALKHAFRRDDVSGTTDTFLALLSLPSIGNAPFCNGTEFDDNDPIRRPCDGNGQSTGGENVCRRTTLAKETGNPAPTNPVWGAVTSAAAPSPAGRGDLGLVLPVVTPEFIADQFPNNTPCAVNGFGGQFKYAPMPLSLLPAAQQLCPNGVVRALNACLWPVDASGNFGCVNSATNRPPIGTVGFVSAMDGRVYNMTARRANGSIPTTPRKSGNNVVQRPLFNVGFYRIHQRTLQTNASGSTCQEASSTNQIGCLVHASPCSIGFAGLGADQQDPNKVLALGTPAGTSSIAATEPNIRRLLQDCATGDFDERYPLSRKLYLNTLVGFENVTNTPVINGVPTLTQEAQLVRCWQDRRFVDRAADVAGFITLTDKDAPGSCFNQALPGDPTSFSTPTDCDLGDDNPGTEIEACP